MHTGTEEGDRKWFEEEYRKAGHKIEKLNDNCYIVNGSKKDFKKFEKQKILVMLPYCLKILAGNKRLTYTCDSKCTKCTTGPLCKFFEDQKINYNFIIYDDKDVPRWIKENKEKHGKLHAALIILCPTAAVENMSFLDHYPNVPIFLYFINGFVECDFSKATKGKFWGESTLNFQDFKNKFKETFD